MGDSRAIVPFVPFRQPNDGAIVPYAGRPTTVVQEIMNKFVSSRSVTRYTNENVLLMVWLFDEDAEMYLHDWIVERMVKAHETDEEASTQQRKHLRAVCKEALANVNKIDNNCPIILEKITFNVFSHFLTTRRNRHGNLLSKSAYGSIRSALMYLHKLAGYETSIEFRQDMTQFNRGIKRKVAEEKMETGVSLEEGKKAMTFEVYKLMCDKLIKTGTNEATFAHLFLILEWNLMARSDNCKNLQLGHIEWRHDCLVFFFGKTKGDQTGDHSDTPWHVYSNPTQPTICPVLALAKYLLSNPDILKSGSPLFPGNDQYNRFIKAFHRIIHDNIQEFKALGVEENMLGSHSCRKGAITLVSTGCTVSPPLASVCLRAGWSMGAVKDRYIHYEKAGDQFTGRSVCGISSTTKEFALSPVYWDFTNVDDEAATSVASTIAETVVDSNEVSSCTFELLRFLFAAICYHYDFLTNKLSQSDKLRASPLFIAAGLFEHKNAATTAYPWTATQYTTLPTGIPPHSMILVELETVKNELNEQTTTIIANLKEELDRRSVGGTDYETKQLLNELKGMLQQNRLATNETTQDERNDDDVGDFILDMEDTDNTTTVNRKLPPSLKVYGTKNGHFQLVPDNFQFPTLTLATLVSMWFCGDKANSIPPYKLLKSWDLSVFPPLYS